MTYSLWMRWSVIPGLLQKTKPRNNRPSLIRPDPDDLRRWTDEAAQQWSHTLERLAE